MDGFEDEFGNADISPAAFDDTGDMMGAGDMTGENAFGDYGDNDVFEDTLGMETADMSSFNQTMPAVGQAAANNTSDIGLVQNMTSDEWSKNSIRPESTERWHQKTFENLNHAKALSRHAQKSMMDNAHASNEGSRRHQNSTQNVQNMIKKKMGITSDLIKALEDRIESVEDTIRQVGESLFSLERARRSKWAPLNVCERRLELRDGRPLQELIRDQCQEAMEHERQTLLEARQELEEQTSTTKEMLMNLENAKASLVSDLQNKRHSMRIDRSCLSPGKLKSGSTQDRLVLPSLQDVANYGQPPTPNTASKPVVGASHEESRQLDARQLIQAAIHLEEDAVRLCNASDAAMIATKKECTRASNMALDALARRCHETDDLKKRIEIQLRETDETIVQTEMSLTKTKKKLDSHEQPLNALDKQFHMRGKRTQTESIRDNVHEELESHLDSVKKSVKALSNKYQSTKDVLEQLRSSKDRMVQDHRSKQSALKIDDSCLKVTPRKAIELDRKDPVGGRCVKPSTQKPNGKRPMGMQQSYDEASYTY